MNKVETERFVGVLKRRFPNSSVTYEVAEGIVQVNLGNETVLSTGYNENTESMKWIFGLDPMEELCNIIVQELDTTLRD